MFEDLAQGVVEGGRDGGVLLWVEGLGEQLEHDQPAGFQLL